MWNDFWATIVIFQDLIKCRMVFWPLCKLQEPLMKKKHLEWVMIRAALHYLSIEWKENKEFFKIPIFIALREHEMIKSTVRNSKTIPSIRMNFS